MRPYYNEDGCIIYHADSGEVLPTLEAVHAVISDPPYGLMQHDGKVQMRGSVGNLDYGDWDHAYSFDWIGMLPAGINTAVVFHDQKRATECWDALASAGITPKQFLFWDKGDSGINPRQNFVNAVEQALYGRRGPAPWNGGGSTVNIFRRDRTARTTSHPTEKPEDLLAWIIRCVTDPGETIVDPFMGSGTTLVAAKRLGRHGVGIEIEERYCEIAAKRLRQRVLDFSERQA